MTWQYDPPMGVITIRTMGWTASVPLDDPHRVYVMSPGEELDGDFDIRGGDIMDPRSELPPDVKDTLEREMDDAFDGMRAWNAYSKERRSERL